MGYAFQVIILLSCSMNSRQHIPPGYPISYLTVTLSAPNNTTIERHKMCFFEVHFDIWRYEQYSQDMYMYDV